MRFSCCYSIMLSLLFEGLADSSSSSPPPSKAPIKEYCNMDTFNPNCSHESNQVVVMETSQYGLMRLGRCLKVDYSKKLGCKVDVLSVMDRKCSGKSWCQVRIPDEETYRINQCPPEFTSFLEASYQCIRVEQEIPMKCDSGIVVKTTTGYISNVRSDNTRCKWFVSVQKGQKVNLTLYDFFHHHQQQQQQSSQKDSSLLLATSPDCVKYAIIREITPQSKELTICGRGLRARTVYLSDSNNVEIVVLSSPWTEASQQPRFLIKFEAVGCPDLDPSSSGSPWTVTRDGDRATISCNSTLDNTKHHLLCRGSQWVGEIPSCSARTTDHGNLGWGLRNIALDNWTSSQGLFTVIIMGVVLGVLLGAVMLIPLLFYFKRRDTLKHRILMMTTNMEGQIFEANGSEVQSCPVIDKSSFALSQHHVHNEVCSWYAREASIDENLKTNCCATPIHQIPHQTIIDDCQWSHCPPRSLPEKKQHPPTYLVKAPPVVDYLEHDYDCPK